MYSINDINAVARFKPVEIDYSSLGSERRGVETCVDRLVLLSDHNLHREDLGRKPRILAADGRYFFGKISQFNEEGYNFLHRNGESHEHVLKYGDLSGLLALDGKVNDDFPRKFRKLHNGEMVSEVLKNVGKTVLFGLNNEFMEESYIAGRFSDHNLPQVMFEVPVIGGDLEQFEMSLGVLTGMFVGSE